MNPETCRRVIVVEVELLEDAGLATLPAVAFIEHIVGSRVRCAKFDLAPSLITTETTFPSVTDAHEGLLWASYTMQKGSSKLDGQTMQKGQQQKHSMHQLVIIQSAHRATQPNS